MARQGQRSVTLAPGELTLLQASTPYFIEFSQANRMSVLAVPLNTTLLELDEHMLVRHNIEQGALLAAFIRRLETLDSSADTYFQSAHYTRLAQDLLRLTWPTPTRYSRSRMSPNIWAQRIDAVIERNLADSTLDAKSLGNALGISARYIQMIFAQRGETLCAHLLEHRLRLSAQLLRDAPLLAITDVAYEAGFSDLSHFCRSFKRRFGISARQWRRGEHD